MFLFLLSFYVKQKSLCDTSGSTYAMVLHYLFTTEKAGLVTFESEISILLQNLKSSLKSLCLILLNEKSGNNIKHFNVSVTNCLHPVFVQYKI